MLVPFFHRPPQVHGDGVEGGGDVQRQADGRGGDAGQLAAQRGGVPGRAG